jgi:release factor glutamine methyltransferase
MTPQSASEQLVAVACASLNGRVAQVADVGTGSGALAIAIAKRCANVKVWATDTSLSACVLAEANVRRHSLEERVFIREGDLLAPVPGRFGLIVANLPYLAAHTAVAHPELAGQPFTAVFAPGDGLEPYRRLLATAHDRLADGGLLLLQLHRRVMVARPADLPAFRHRFGLPHDDRGVRRYRAALATGAHRFRQHL